MVWFDQPAGKQRLGRLNVSREFGDAGGEEHAEDAGADDFFGLFGVAAFENVDHRALGRVVGDRRDRRQRRGGFSAQLAELPGEFVALRALRVIQLLTQLGDFGLNRVVLGVPALYVVWVADLNVAFVGRGEEGL